MSNSRDLGPDATGIPIGQRVRERRRELNLTQGELARRAGMSVSYLSLIEHDKRTIGGRLLQRLAPWLGARGGGGAR